MSKKAPTGVGIFVWEPSQCEGGDVEKVVAKAKASGISWIVLHGFLLASWVNALKAAGFYVSYSRYVTPQTTASFLMEAQVACHLGVDAVFLDAEVEWEKLGDAPHWYGNEATEFVTSLRKMVGPDIFIADAGAWAYPNLHPNYPDREFAAVLDAAMPERYWTESGESADDYLTKSENAWEQDPDVRGYAQVIPIGCVYGTNTTPKGGVRELTTEDVMAFIMRYPTCALWSWASCPQAVWDVLSKGGVS